MPVAGNKAESRSALQVLAGVWIVRNDHGDGLACVQFRAVAAGLEAFLQGALADLAELIAVDGLGSVRAAPFAVDVFRQNRDMVQLGSQFRCLLAQRLIVVDRGEIRVALFAIQAANGDHGFHRLFLLEYLFSPVFIEVVEYELRLMQGDHRSRRQSM